MTVSDQDAKGRRVALAAAGAVIGAGAALAADPFGTYRPEQHVLALTLGAALGALAGGLLPSVRVLERRARWGFSAAIALAAAILAHPAGIALAFSWAADRSVAYAALALGAGLAAGAALRRWGLLELLVLAAAPVVLVTSVHHARFLRAPGVDCAALASQPGVEALSTWPDHVDPSLTGALVYDVVREAPFTAAAFVRQGEDAGCGAVVVWEDGGGHTILEAPFRSGTHDGPPTGCWMTARLVLEGGRLFVPLSSYDGALPPRLLSWDLRPGAAPKPAAEAELVLDPADVLAHQGRLLVLSYPRRFASDGSSAVAAIDPATLNTLSVSRFEPDGWMTEYLVPADDALYVTDVLGHFYELDPATLDVRREASPGASMLGGVVAGPRVFVAAPYRRAALVLDRASLAVLAELPGGDALRDLAVDHTRQRLYGIGYGDGRLYGWDLSGSGRALGSIAVGPPLRGLERSDGRLWTAGGCGVFSVDPGVLE